MVMPSSDLDVTQILLPEQGEIIFKVITTNQVFLEERFKGSLMHKGSKKTTVRLFARDFFHPRFHEVHTRTPAACPPSRCDEALRRVDDFAVRFVNL